MRRGDLLGERYVIDRLVGQGASGDVYRAEDRRGAAPAAIKVLRLPREEVGERFEREASALAGLEHPGVVRLLAHGRLPEGQPWLAMEWLDGEDLAQRLARGPLAVVEALALGEAVAAALAAAHARGVVHRDIKPANIFLPGGDPRRAKLLDFGLARLPGAHGLTVTGAFLGTPSYMAPEQVRGARRVDGRADLYGLGGVLFECLAGRPPFAGDAHLLGLMTRILTEPAPRLGDVRPDVPATLDAVVAALLEKAPEARPAGAEAVARMLSAIAAGEDLGLGAAPGAGRSPTESPPARRSSLTAMEQRLLSVVLIAPPRPRVSPLDATMLASGPDTAALEAITAAVSPFDARVEGLLDGAAVVLLAGRASATDQAADAARCALAARRAAGDRWIALCTGRGHLGSRPSCSETSAMAAMLLESAMRRGEATALEGAPGASPAEPAEPPEPGAIVIDEVTAGLLDARFQVLERGGMRWLTGEDALGEPARLVLGRPTPFLGRERELGFLRDLFEEVRQEETAAAALVLGEAGMGKSRLGWELVAAVRARCPGASIWIGRAEPMGAATAFGLIASALRAAAGIREGEPPAERHVRLAALVARAAEPARAAAITEALGELVGARPDADDCAEPHACRRDLVVLGDQIRLAFGDLVAAAATPAAPLLLLLEDLHWADLPSLQLVDLVLRTARERPLLVVGLSRPDLEALHPRLWAERGVHELRLGGLPRRAAERLARQALGESADVADIVERAAGHPLFLEELIRASAPASSQPGAAPPPPEERAATPETVLAMVQARIERLDPEARRVLRAASVFGEVFWRGGVSRLLGGPAGCPDLDAWLALLVERELVHPARASRFPGDAEYAFRHALMREAAYRMLTLADRAAGHELAAEFLEEAGEDRAAVLAEHHDRGGAPARALPLHLRAARQALEGTDLASVLTHAERAIACGAEGEALGEALSLAAEAQQWQGAYEEAARLAATAMAHLPRAGDRWCEAAEALAIAAGRRLDAERLPALAGELAAAARAGAQSDAFLIAALRTWLQAYVSGFPAEAAALLDAIGPLVDGAAGRQPQVEALILVARAHQALAAWQLDVPSELLEQAAVRHERAGDLRSACAQRLDTGLFLAEAGRYQQALDVLEAVLPVIDRLGLSRLSSVGRAMVGALQGRLGRLDEGVAILEDGIRALDALGDVRMGGWARYYLARMHLARGELDAAVDLAAACAERVAVSPRFRARMLSVVARARALQGRTAEALAASSEAVATLDQFASTGMDEIVIRGAHARALIASGDLDAARAVVALARERLLWQAAHIQDAAVRQSFLHEVLEHREIFELAAALGLP